MLKGLKMVPAVAVGVVAISLFGAAITPNWRLRGQTITTFVEVLDTADQRPMRVVGAVVYHGDRRCVSIYFREGARAYARSLTAAALSAIVSATPEHVGYLVRDRANSYLGTAALCRKVYAYVSDVRIGAVTSWSPAPLPAHEVRSSR